MLTPDGARYIQPGRVARPFNLRWLLPALCGPHIRRWQIVAYASAIAYSGLLWAYTGRWWACLLGLGLAGVIPFNVKHPVLVDLPAMTLALGASLAALNGLWWLAVPLVLIAGCVKETAPVFATLYAWHPIMLVGLLPVVFRVFQKPGPDPLAHYPQHVEILAHPMRSSWKFHRSLPLWLYVLPWGACLAGLSNGSPQLWVTLAVAYGQCLMATDTVRLYQWAAAPVILATVGVLPGAWLPVILAVHLVNPYRTEGI